MKPLIYLDNNATTALDPKVWECMQEYASIPLNPSSSHSYGMLAKKLVKTARREIASRLHIHPETLIFTSGGTESLNMLIRGLYKGKGVIVTTSIEHSAVDTTLHFLQTQGATVRRVPVGSLGTPTLSSIEERLQEDVSLLVFSAVYSETGAKIDLEGVASLALKYNIPLVIDGVALLGKEPFTLSAGIAGMAFSSHKLHGPSGIGAAYLNPSFQIDPLLYGAHQQGGLRPGTEPVLGILGFAKAVALAYDLMNPLAIALLRDSFEEQLRQELSISINGEGPRICNLSNIAFHDLDAETLLLALDREGICASMGSACSAGAIEPSRILLQMGYTRARAKSSLRFSLSKATTQEEIERASSAVLRIAKQLLTTCY